MTDPSNETVIIGLKPEELSTFESTWLVLVHVESPTAICPMDWPTERQRVSRCLGKYLAQAIEP